MTIPLGKLEYRQCSVYRFQKRNSERFPEGISFPFCIRPRESNFIEDDAKERVLCAESALERDTWVAALMSATQGTTSGITPSIKNDHIPIGSGVSRKRSLKVKLADALGLPHSGSMTPPLYDEQLPPSPPASPADYNHDSRRQGSAISADELMATLRDIELKRSASVKF